MAREELGSLAAFVAVAEARSFTKAAGKLGTSQSALSHRVRRLEERLGIRLLTRNTRSVAVTEAGTRLLETLQPALNEIDAQLDALTESGTKLAGTVRISSADHAAETILWPVIRRLTSQYPEVVFHVDVDNSLVDIVAEKYDAGIRMGGFIAKDMIAVPIGPPEKSVVVASPSYLQNRTAPSVPRDLLEHQCINRGMISSGGIKHWEFQGPNEQFKMRVSGALTFNRPEMILEAALAGHGCAYLLESQVRRHVDAGRLSRVLEEWSIALPSYYLYYPSRKQQVPGMQVLIEAIRYRQPKNT